KTRQERTAGEDDQADDPGENEEVAFDCLAAMQSAERPTADLNWLPGTSRYLCRRCHQLSTFRPRVGTRAPPVGALACSVASEPRDIARGRIPPRAISLVG